VQHFMACDRPTRMVPTSALCLLSALLSGCASLPSGDMAVLAPDRRCQPALPIVPETNDITLWRAGPNYSAEMWFYRTFNGTACLTTRGEGSFVVDWDAPTYGFLHEVGLYDLDVPLDTIPATVTAQHDHQLTLLGGAGAYTGLYGWMGTAGRPEAIEFYINENWIGSENGASGVKDMSEATRMGVIEVDGGIYDIYMRPRAGDRFAQWWSNRRTPRTSGTISYARHFAAWRALGLGNERLTRLTFAVESRWGAPSRGVADYRRIRIDRPDGRPLVVAPHF
jgi:Glycosyl hydrolases family 11